MGKWIMICILFYCNFDLKEKIKKLELELETHKIDTTKNILFLNQECNYTLNQSNLLLEELMQRNQK